VRILVIGGTGFVGPHVIRRLAAKGHEILCFHRVESQADLPSEVAHLHGDRAKLAVYRERFARFAPDVVLDTRPMNEQDARTAMETFRGIARRLVALSSGDVYRAYGVIQRSESGSLEPTPITEDAPLRERLYPYRGETPRTADDPMRWVDDYEKILVERVVMGDPELSGTVLRLPMIYGPGDDYHRLFAYLKRMDDCRPAIVVEDSEAAWRWTRGFVEDLADAIVLALVDDRASGRIYNVGEPDALSLADWVRAIGQAAGWTGAVVAIPGERLPEQFRKPLNFAQDLVYDTARIRAELGYQESVRREEAIAKTVAWERAHPPASIDPRDFDYDLEDTALAEAAACDVSKCR
jgi:nucleoside-diphosphate-sugar epimerase